MQHGIPNLHTVAPGILRGGQPESEGWEYLRSVGITNILKLNTSSEGSDDGAVALGMTVNYFPIDKIHQIALKPNPEYVRAAVGKIQPGTFVHCLHGEDRTGLIVGCYRVWVQGAKKSDAYKEMNALGFHATIEHGLNEFWEDNVATGK